jgi:SDR family mycofactocin-dependent oxidoreductase
MSRFDGKVAFITGAARGQGRVEAVRLAREGADIIAIDVAAAVETSIAAPATPEDLAETVHMVEALDRRIYSAQADVRDYDKLKFALDEGVAELGRLDIVIANAGMWSYGLAHELSEEAWRTVIDVDLTGVWHTMKAAIPILKAQGTGGSIILTSSALGLAASPNVAHYVAAKHGVVGLMRTLALELASDNIRVNTVNPTSVNTDLIQNASTYELFAPDLAAADRTREAIVPRFATLTPMNIPWVEPEDVANAVAWLASDEARYVTGITLPVDAGQLLK